MPAGTAAIRIIEKLKEVTKGANEGNAAKVSIFIKGSHLPLAYLWAINKGLAKPIILSNPPESETINEEATALLDQLKAPGNGGDDQGSSSQQKKGNKKKKKSRRKTSKKSKKSNKTSGPNGGGGSGSDSSSSSNSSSSKSDSSGPDLLSKEVAAALIQNINVLLARQLEDKERERRKSSMMSQMGPKTEKLFYLLSARDWDEKKPKLNSFMKMLTEEKGMSRAVKVVQSKMKRWDGTVTASGLVQFLSSGYICKNLDNKPGGFTFFMFRPAYVEGAHNPKLVEQSICETFGDEKLSDDTVKYYANMNYHLPSNYEDFLFQLDACYRALELFTCQRGIAAKGYQKPTRSCLWTDANSGPYSQRTNQWGYKLGGSLTTSSKISAMTWLSTRSIRSPSDEQKES
jgi:hypothetical protein